MAFSSVLSASEREYIIGGVKDDVRVDGRGCRNVRHFTLKTGVVSNTSGSAKIERVWGNYLLQCCLAYELTHFPGANQCYYWCQGRIGSAKPLYPKYG